MAVAKSLLHHLQTVRCLELVSNWCVYRRILPMRQKGFQNGNQMLCWRTAVSCCRMSQSRRLVVKILASAVVAAFQLVSGSVSIDCGLRAGICQIGTEYTGYFF
uniref:Uncharacterized protein n=1 Tax=Ixodes ricinus TaxID=34613 RepID=A0A6B0UG32_IXORI